MEPELVTLWMRPCWQIRVDRAGTVSCTRFDYKIHASEVLNDLNSSTPGPGTVTQQMGIRIGMLSGQSSSLLHPHWPTQLCRGYPDRKQWFCIHRSKRQGWLLSEQVPVLIPYTGQDILLVVRSSFPRELPFNCKTTMDLVGRTRMDLPEFFVP